MSDSEKLQTMLIRVLGGESIRHTAKAVWGHHNTYYRKTTPGQQAEIKRARAEYLSKTTPEPTTVVRRAIDLPLSRWQKLQAYCHNTNQPVNTYVNRLINDALGKLPGVDSPDVG